MPIKHAAMKALRASKKRTQKNLRMRVHVKSLSKQLKTAVAAGKKTEAAELSRKLQQAVAKASKTHVLHRNKADRMASAGMRSVASMK